MWREERPLGILLRANESVTVLAELESSLASFQLDKSLGNGVHDGYGVGDFAFLCFS